MNKKTSVKSRLMRILLSGGFVLSSAAYAAWQHAVAIPKPQMRSIAAAPKQPAPQQVAVIQFATPLTQNVPPPRTSDSPARSVTLAAAEPKPAGSKPEDAYTPPPATPPRTPIINIDPSVHFRTATGGPTTTVAQAHEPYADGDYTGKIADTDYGAVQVKAVVRGGVVAQVTPLDFPNHRDASIEINDWAIPLLEQEAVTVQTADIDLVSQATVTSYGYQESLASALAQAKKQ